MKLQELTVLTIFSTPLNFSRVLFIHEQSVTAVTHIYRYGGKPVFNFCFKQNFDNFYFFTMNLDLINKLMKYESGALKNIVNSFVKKCKTLSRIKH